MDSISELMSCASFAHHGLLDSVDQLELCDIDLSTVPAQHLASLVSCVKSRLIIKNVIGYNLAILLTSLKCQEFEIRRQSLGREETQALVQAMESGVETLVIREQETTLDIEALVEYSGQGKCRYVVVFGDTTSSYRKELRTWAKSRNWRVEEDNKEFVMGRRYDTCEKSFRSIKVKLRLRFT